MDRCEYGFYPIESIIAFRVNSSLPEYKVKWIGYNKPTWEPLQHLSNLKDDITMYNKEHQIQIDVDDYINKDIADKSAAYSHKPVKKASIKIM